MNPVSPNLTILQWLKTHPGIFNFHEEGGVLHLVENYSQKALSLAYAELADLEEKANSTSPHETYLVLRLHSGIQWVLASQGFVFPPDFRNTGPLTLPSQVYCMQDFNNLFHRLRHVAAESERGREALDLVLALIAILDGAKAIGLPTDAEAREIETILNSLEKGEPLTQPH